MTKLLVRTFLPAALKHHSVACTEDRPLFKAKSGGYTSNMKAKVQYPVPKTKQSSSASETKIKNDSNGFKNEIHSNGVAGKKGMKTF